MLSWEVTGKGVSLSASGPRQRRRILRKRHAAFQTQVREIRNPFRAEEETALREAQREAQAQDDSGPQEDAPEALGGAAGDALTSSHGDGGDREALELPIVLRLIASLARTPPGRAAILSLEPSVEEPEVRR